MPHNYHAQNGLTNEVVGDFSDDEDEIQADNNNINDNDNNDIQFLFQPTSIENVYRSYPNSVDVSGNQVTDNPDYRHFLDQQQQSDLQDGELFVGQRFLQLEDLKHAINMRHIKNHVTFKHMRYVKDTWVLCCLAEECQRKLRASK